MHYVCSYLYYSFGSNEKWEYITASIFHLAGVSPWTDTLIIMNGKGNPEDMRHEPDF